MSWYHIASDKIARIRDIAKQIYLEESAAYDDDTLQALCLDVSNKLKQRLIENGFNAKLVMGKFAVDDPDLEYSSEWNFDTEEEFNDAAYNPLHYWVEVDGIIVDVTAHQFNDEIDSDIDKMPYITVGTYSEFPGFQPERRI